MRDTIVTASKFSGLEFIFRVLKLQERGQSCSNQSAALITEGRIEHLIIVENIYYFFPLEIQKILALHPCWKQWWLLTNTSLHVTKQITRIIIRFSSTAIRLWSGEGYFSEILKKQVFKIMFWYILESYKGGGGERMCHFLKPLKLTQKLSQKMSYLFFGWVPSFDGFKISPQPLYR